MSVKLANPADVPEHDRLEERDHNCAFDGPPHSFDQGWATPADGRDDTVPVLFCAACGEVRALRLTGE